MSRRRNPPAWADALLFLAAVLGGGLGLMALSWLATGRFWPR